MTIPECIAEMRKLLDRMDAAISERKVTPGDDLDQFSGLADKFEAFIEAAEKEL